MYAQQYSLRFKSRWILHCSCYILCVSGKHLCCIEGSELMYHPPLRVVLAKVQPPSVLVLNYDSTPPA